MADNAEKTGRKIFPATNPREIAEIQLSGPIR